MSFDRALMSYLTLSHYVFSYEFGGPVGVTSMMLGFPILMYYLWICLVFYGGRIVRPSSLQDIVPFIQRMWVHVRDVSIEYIIDSGDHSSYRILLLLGCGTNAIRIRDVHWSHGFPASPCFHHARLYTGRPPCPVIELQDSQVQLQRAWLLLFHPRDGLRLAR